MTARTRDPLDSDIDRRGVVGAVVTSMSWAATGVWVNLAPALSPLALVAWRLLLAAALFWLLFPRVRRGYGPQAWGLGTLLVAYYLAAVFAFQRAPVGEVALCIGCAPLFVLLYQALGGRWPARRELAAVALTLSGLAVMVWPGLRGAGGGAAWSGLSVALLAAALTAAYATLHRRLALRRRAPGGAEIGRAAFAPLGAALMVAVSLHGPVGQVLPLAPQPVIAVIGLGLVSTALPTLAVAVASSRLPAFINTLIRLTTPLFAAGFGWAFLGQQPTAWTVAGGALVLSGLFVQGVRAGE